MPRPTKTLALFLAFFLAFLVMAGEKRHRDQQEPRQQPRQPEACKNDAVTWKQLDVSGNVPGMFTYMRREDQDQDGRFECIRLKFKNTNDFAVKYEGEWSLDADGEVQAKQWSVMLNPGESSNNDEPDLLSCVNTQRMQKKELCKVGLNLRNGIVTRIEAPSEDPNN